LEEDLSADGALEIFLEADLVVEVDARSVDLW
jgi:hypothetical protein